jgi:hypothetical protein
MSKSENHDSWEDERKTIAGLSPERGDGHEKNAGLEVTPGEIGPDPGPSHQNGQPGSQWPPPPVYPGNNSYEMQNLAPQATSAATARAEPPAKAPREQFDFRFYGPRQDIRKRYFTYPIIFFVILVVVLTLVFSINSISNK